ncbi:MAG: hypothetical protein IJZ53_06015 [Tyzzerella sp.]|nr:hypothetical protein [Tyzzerella sp.]
MRTCSLCGGKLDNHKRCTLCGLDNTKNDSMYKHLLNQSNCEHAPLTHVHEEPVKNTYSKTYSEAKYNSSTFRKASKTTRTKKKGSKSLAATVVSVITIVVALMSGIIELVEDIRYESSYEESYTEEYSDPYEYVVDAMPDEGEAFKVVLEPGIYKVGAHIPAGFYNAELVSGNYGYISIDDYDNWIYHTENMNYQDKSIVYDLRLYDGAYFTVSSNITVNIYAENAQPITAVPQTNPLTQSVAAKGEMTAGEDFEAGMYDIVYQPAEGYEYGYVEYTVSDEEGYDYSWSVYFDSDVGAEIFHNVALPKGATINIGELENITLVPSASIFSTNYNEFYEGYY